MVDHVLISQHECACMRAVCARAQACIRVSLASASFITHKCLSLARETGARPKPNAKRYIRNGYFRFRKTIIERHAYAYICICVRTRVVINNARAPLRGTRTRGSIVLKCHQVQGQGAPVQGYKREPFNFVVYQLQLLSRAV